MKVPMMNLQKITDGFPLEYLAFCRNELSVSVERNGGINSIFLLDMEELDGKIYPDRGRLPLFSREKFSSMGRVLYGPAIRFITSVDGREYMHRPGAGEIAPSGVAATLDEDEFHSSYEMQLGNGAVFFEFGCVSEKRERLAIVLSRLHVGNLELPSLKSHFVCTEGEWGIHWLPPQYRGADFNPASPLPGKTMKLQWTRFAFENGVFLMQGTLSFEYGNHPLFVVLTSDVPLRFREKKEQWILEAPWEGREKIRFAIGYGRSYDDAFSNARNAMKDHSARLENFASECTRIMNAAPVYHIEGMPVAEQFMRIAPVYQNSLLLGETASQAAIRASAYKFGYFALWDHIYPIRDFMSSGRPEIARKLIVYLLDYPHIKTALWATFQLILATDEYLAFQEDPGLLKQAWGTFKNWFEFALTLTDSETGLVKFSLGMGCDNPRELGCEELFYASCMNAWWHGTCRVMENFALEMDEPGFAQKASSFAQKLEKHYLRCFHVPEAGYLTTALDLDKKASIRIYHNSASISVEYPFGRGLVRGVISGMARYQAKKLYHSQGHLAVSWDSDVCCEMWRFVHMNQHLGHECKLARFAGDSAEAVRVMSGYFDYFRRTLNAVETFNYFGCDGDVNELADWQAFSATAATHAVQQGICGLFWHRGGLCYTQAADTKTIRIENFRLAGHRFDISIHGNGAFAGRVSINGTELKGSLQLPADLLRKENTVELIRSNVPLTRPVLLYAFDLSVTALESTETMLSFRSSSCLHTDLLFYVPRESCLKIDGLAVNAEYSQERHELFYSGIVCKNSLIELILKEYRQE